MLEFDLATGERRIIPSRFPPIPLFERVADAGANVLPSSGGCSPFRLQGRYVHTFTLGAKRFLTRALAQIVLGDLSAPGALQSVVIDAGPARMHRRRGPDRFVEHCRVTR